MKKTLKFMRKICFEVVPPLIDDGQLIACKGCGGKDWLIDEIKHEENCEVGAVLNEINNGITASPKPPCPACHANLDLVWRCPKCKKTYDGLDQAAS